MRHEPPLGTIEFAPHHRDLAPDCAFVGSSLVRTRLKPLQHFAHQIALRFWKALNEDSPRHGCEERVPIVLRRYTRTCRPATCLLATGGRALVWTILMFEPLNLRSDYQNIRRGDRDAFRWLADPLPFALARRADTPDAYFLKSHSVRSIQRDHIGRGDVNKVTEPPRRFRFYRRHRYTKREQAKRLNAQTDALNKEYAAEASALQAKLALYPQGSAQWRAVIDQQTAAYQKYTDDLKTLDAQWRKEHQQIVDQAMQPACSNGKARLARSSLRSIRNCADYWPAPPAGRRRGERCSAT